MWLAGIACNITYVVTGGVVTLGALKVTIEQLRLKHQEWLKWLNLVGDPDYLAPPTGATPPSWVPDGAA